MSSRPISPHSRGPFLVKGAIMKRGNRSGAHIHRQCVARVSLCPDCDWLWLDSLRSRMGGACSVAIVIALAVWAFVSWAYRRKLAVLKAESGAWEARFAFAHERETVVSQKRNELEATVQLLSKQITASATTQEVAATTQRVTMVARALASANLALSKALTS